MNTVVYKYTFPEGFFHGFITLPQEAQILSIQEQNGKMTLWAVINPLTNFGLDREFLLLPTGSKLPIMDNNDLNYISTTQRVNGCVVHAFEYKQI